MDVLAAISAYRYFSAGKEEGGCVYALLYNKQRSRGKWGKVRRKFSSVSPIVYIANMVIFMY